MAATSAAMTAAGTDGWKQLPSSATVNSGKEMAVEKPFVYPDTFRQRLVRKRLERRIDDGDAATMFGFSLSEYGDLEARDDEWATVVPAHTIGVVVRYFTINWWECARWPDGSVKSIDGALDKFCRGLCNSLTLSRQGFADRVGFSRACCDVIEGHPEGLSLWPVEVARSTAREFDVDERALIGKLLRSPVPANA